MIIPYNGINPQIDESCYVAHNATIVGNVVLKENANIWYGTVIRADDNKVTIGKNTNVQDNCTIHISNVFETIVGNNVTIGHGAIVHACEIGDNTLIGMGSIILNGAIIGNNVIVGAGSLVPPGKKIPSNTLVMGSPAKIVRSLNEEDIEKIKKSAMDYVRLANNHKGVDKI